MSAWGSKTANRSVRVHAQIVTLDNRHVKVRLAAPSGKMYSNKAVSYYPVLISLLLRSILKKLGLQCWIPGQCNGAFVDQISAETSQQCLEACQDNQLCQWFTHDSDDSVCILLETCLVLESECLTCISGQNLCSEYERPGGIFFVKLQR